MGTRLLERVYRCNYCNPEPSPALDEHAPPQYELPRICCPQPQLLAGLPIDFPAQISPLIQSWILDTPAYSFLTRPILPDEGILRCHVTKYKGVFQLYLELPEVAPEASAPGIVTIDSSIPFEDLIAKKQLCTALREQAIELTTRSEPILLLTARRKRTFGGSVYTISDSFGAIGSLRSNFGGTKFQLFDLADREIALIRYTHFFSGTGSPIQTELIIPRYNFIPGTSITEQTDSLDKYTCVKPVWHDGMNAYVMHFSQHRVTDRSIKNFRINSHDTEPGVQTEQTLMMQFGRVLGDRSKFILDFRYPLSPIVAFAVALSSIDPKLTV